FADDSPSNPFPDRSDSALGGIYKKIGTTDRTFAHPHPSHSSAPRSRVYPGPLWWSVLRPIQDLHYSYIFYNPPYQTAPVDHNIPSQPDKLHDHFLHSIRGYGFARAYSD